MRPAFSRLTALLRLLALLLLVPVAAGAQSMFAAALYVNDEPITNYQIEQKMRFLEFIGTTSEDPQATAIERLIEDRLMIQEARRLGGRLTPDMINDGLAEFAARGQVTGEELLSRAEAAGIDRDTVMEFIRAGLLWRELVRQAYGAQVIITESQIEQALSVEGVQPTTEVLISELFLPTDPQFAQALERILPQIERITSETEFANAARQVSVAPSGPQGGRVDRWIDLTTLPPPLGPALANANPGDLIGPIEMPGALAYFLLRGKRDTRAVPPAAIELDYRRASLPGGRSEANTARVAAIRAGTDSCADFPGEVLRAAPELAPESVQSVQMALPQVPGPVRAELERLNPGQISSGLVEGEALVVLMLCARRVAAEGTPSREDMRLMLINRALEGQSAIYLQRLRAEAEIRRP